MILQGSIPNVCTAASYQHLPTICLPGPCSSTLPRPRRRGGRRLPTRTGNPENLGNVGSVGIPENCGNCGNISVGNGGNVASLGNLGNCGHITVGNSGNVTNIGNHGNCGKIGVGNSGNVGVGISGCTGGGLCQGKRLGPVYCSLQHLLYSPGDDRERRTEERLRKLESERGALRMEVSVLSDQVDAQTSKIQELEGMLQEKKDSLRRMEEALQKEVLSRSALETQKLELLSSLSEMKLRQASLEHENLALRATSPVSNGERFVRHAGQYSSLPRAPSSSKKGVVFEEEKNVIVDAGPVPDSPAERPLSELSMEEIADWLSKLGLECYAPELRRWGATGAKLLEATQSQLEKELELKNVLHRKKLFYAIESEKSSGAGFLGSDKMDNGAVLRWLDDIGLPQHKEAFHSGKVDGRVLHRLTTEDLFNLGVTAQLHAASLRRGIQVLRELNFDFDHLERRSSTGNGADSSNVTLWTNHRVMEWLRVVDLAEYAPNMRGSGVHGGLMVHEARFTSELMATLLSISPGKTLLRRHLTTHFNQLLGREVVAQKREAESSLGFVPLTLTARLKVPKKSQFTLKRKKSKNEADYGNLVCPLEASPPGTPSTPSSTPGSPNFNSPTF